MQCTPSFPRGSTLNAGLGENDAVRNLPPASLPNGQFPFGAPCMPGIGYVQFERWMLLTAKKPKVGMRILFPVGDDCSFLSGFSGGTLSGFSHSSDLTYVVWVQYWTRRASATSGLCISGL